jgi:hypothetical protein
VAFIWLGLTLGMLATVTMFGGTPVELVVFLFAVSAGCVIWGLIRLLRVRASA